MKAIVLTLLVALSFAHQFRGGMEPFQRRIGNGQYFSQKMIPRDSNEFREFRNQRFHHQHNHHQIERNQPAPLPYFPPTAHTQTNTTTAHHIEEESNYLYDYINCEEFDGCVGCLLTFGKCAYDNRKHKCANRNTTLPVQDIYETCPADEVAYFEQQMYGATLVVVCLLLMCCVVCVKCCCCHTTKRRHMRRVYRRVVPQTYNCQPVLVAPVQIPMNYPPPPANVNFVQPVYGVRPY
ncbi:hypothetical protein EIN_052240 [Entamoeba invadens IP1]|uniref:hypothetical protein n=1 Tax=Entamoeba invadens IP1 TaxID=370355 RepID=UPI0002C3E897|nr:hypothetical protein EIN_052240 [Entamoeba invadens IP1]ELP93019.1 hypothetical protein EIN_052240 [Entamoeba invadens IP1]|eukprot:XP_004259790.1 hypothetical protein EIN_052240 [Entamoeba invadens IP1]